MFIVRDGNILYRPWIQFLATCEQICSMICKDSWYYRYGWNLLCSGMIGKSHEQRFLSNGERYEPLSEKWDEIQADCVQAYVFTTFIINWEGKDAVEFFGGSLVYAVTWMSQCTNFNFAYWSSLNWIHALSAKKANLPEMEEVSLLVLNLWFRYLPKQICK